MALKTIQSNSVPPDARTRQPPELASGSGPPERDASTRRPPMGWWGRVLAPVPALVLGVAVLALWQSATAIGGISDFLLPPPAQVAQAFVRGISSGLLPGRALVTLGESLAGFMLGTLVAVPLGYGIARSPTLGRMLQPYLAASQAIPAVALAPLLVLWLGGDWLGLDLPPVVALCALIVFFPTAVNTALGIRLLDPDLLDAARLDGAGHAALLRHIELPLALPSILAGMRTSLTLSITGAVVGEFVISDQGLGGLINIGIFDTPMRFATLVMLALLASALYGIARLAERRLSYLEV